MLVVSLWTSLLGFTEPLFVPAYWNPPSLFNLAQKTGFDIESLLFSFGIGGLTVVLYERIFPVRHEVVSIAERHHPRHRFHLFVLLSAPLIFLVLAALTGLNPIGSALLAGARSSSCFRLTDATCARCAGLRAALSQATLISAPSRKSGGSRSRPARATNPPRLARWWTLSPCSWLCPFAAMIHQLRIGLRTP